MKGKKADPQFIAEFISKCVSLGYETATDIVSHAKNMIKEIDEQIKEIDVKRITRSKLLDVVDAFDKQQKDKSEDEKVLPFYKLDNKTICKYVCDRVRKYPAQFHRKELDPDTKFAIKQLIECKILDRDINGDITKGLKYDDYIQFINEDSK